MPETGVNRGEARPPAEGHVDRRRPIAVVFNRLRGRKELQVKLTEERARLVAESLGIIADVQRADFRALPPQEQRAAHAALTRYHGVVATAREALTKKGASDDVMALFFNHHPGAKSALFLRLLRGKDPLPMPPPTYCSYPWYSLFDAPGIHGVSIGGCQTLGSMAAAAIAHGAHDGSFLSIGQAPWRIEWQSSAVQPFCRAVDDIARSREARDPAALAAANAMAYQHAKACVWHVTYGEWPMHRVYWGVKPEKGTGSVDVLPQFVWTDGSFRREDLHDVEILQTAEEVAQQDARAYARSVALCARPHSAENTRDRFSLLAAQAHVDRGPPPPRGPLARYRCSGWVIEPLPNSAA